MRHKNKIGIASIMGMTTRTLPFGNCSTRISICSFLYAIILLVSILFSNSSIAQSPTRKQASRQNKLAWKKEMPRILRRIQPPTFPTATVTITASDNFRKTVQQKIDSLSKSGGGMILISPGVYFCAGPLHLKNNINLHLSKEATIKFSTNPGDYLPVVKVRWEGTVCYNYSPLIYAYQQTNIALTGEGLLDGQADQFWYAWKKQPDGNDQEKDKKTLRDMGRDGLPEEKRVFGEGFKLRPSLIELYECQNILIEGFTLRQSPFWTTHPVFSKNITIRNLTIDKGTTNDDGIDPDGCENVLIENCTIDTDDDPIALKAGRDNDAWPRMSTKNIIIRNIKGRSRVGNGFCIGSEMSGGVENVFVENYYISKADNGINIKSNLDRGGFVKNIYIRNVVIDSAIKTGILMQKDYHSYRGGNFPPKYSELYFQNVMVKYVQKKGMRIAGVTSQSINNVWMHKVKVNRQGEADEIIYTQNLSIQ
jgi:polygalacturonase